MNNRLCINTTLGINLLMLLSAFFLISAQGNGCKRMRPSLPGQIATESRPVNFLLRKLQNKDLSKIKTIHAQAKVFVEGNGESISANANIIWIRDSVMWLNVKKFGLEAARALITPDSIFLINRLNRTWSAKGLESLERQYSLPDGFGLLQQFLLASAWIDPEMELKSEIKDDFHMLSGKNGQLSADYRIEEGTFSLKKQTFNQLRDSRNVVFQFDNFKKTSEAGQFPYLRNIEAFSPETGNVQLDIEINDIEFNVPKNFRFEIPSSYEKVD
jgi:hypothetical protein